MSVSAPFENRRFILGEKGQNFSHALCLSGGADLFARHGVKRIYGSVGFAHKLTSCEQVKNRIAHKSKCEGAER